MSNIEEIRSKERALLSVLRDRYERDGYTFIEHPSKEFFSSDTRFQPDAIALKDEKKIIVEVKMGRRRELRDIIEQQKQKFPGWEMQVFFWEDEFKKQKAKPPAPSEIQSGLLRLHRLILNEFYGEALLVGWSVIEALSRLRPELVVGSEFSNRLTPDRIVSNFEELGVISFSTARRLRTLINKRNDFVHGHLFVAIDRGDAEFMASTIHRIAKEDFELDLVEYDKHKERH